MEVLSINDNDDNDQVNPPEIISSLGLRFSNFSPMGFVKEDLMVSRTPQTPHVNIELSSSSLGHMSDKSVDKISRVKASQQAVHYFINLQTGLHNCFS